MKFIFFVLFSLNVVFFLWEYYGSGPSNLNSDEMIRQTQDPSIDRIILFNERTEDRLPVGSTTKGNEFSVSDQIYNRDEPKVIDAVNQRLSKSIAQDSESLISDLLESATARQMNSQELEVVDDFEIATDLNRLSKIGDSCCPTAKLSVGFKSTGFSVQKDASDEEPTTPNVEEVTDFAGRKDSKQAKNTDSITIGDGAPDSMAESERFCYKLGPRFSRKSFIQIVAKLKQAGLASTIRPEAVEKETGFMVYYPAGKSMEASRANLAKLKSKGLRDLWLINKGEMRGRISLGIFNTRERAEIMKQEMEAKEIYPQVKPKLSKRTGYFLVFDSVLAMDELNDHLIESGFEVEERVPIDPGNCET